MSPEAPSVVVQDLAGAPDTPSEDRIRQWVRAAAGAASGEITVRLVTENESGALNRRYRGRDGATNVLAFTAGGEWPECPGDDLPIGDIVVCSAVLAREAAEQGKALDAHWAHIVVHGTLHLLGYEHDADRDAERMEDRERELLAGLGFSDPYAVPD